MRSFLYLLLMQLLLIPGSPVWSGAQNCTPPLIFTGNEITDTSIILRWFSIDLPETGYQLSLQESGQPPVDSSALFIASPNERDTLFSLEPHQEYTAYIRSICNGDTSVWKSFDFQTAIQNDMTCQLDLDITDNSCFRGGQSIPIFVKSHAGDTLGQNIKLQSVQLIIEHPYPADLRIAIRNTSGRSVELIEHFGSFTDNFGIPGDTSCSQVSEFSQSSCESIYASSPPFLGQYRPEENLNALNDGSPANGKWMLEICDRAADDIGILKHVQLNFTDDVCPHPPTIYPTRLGDTVQNLRFTKIQADSIKILFSTDTAAPVSVSDSTYQQIYADPNDSTLALRGLDLDTTYYAWSFVFCDGQWSGPSCRSSFTTVNAPIDLYSDWEEEGSCQFYCQDPCLIEDPIWQNLGYAWNIRKGPTPTDETGPEADIFEEQGQYIYKESSEVECRENESILQSVCLQKAGGVNGLGFFYHMSGSGVGRLLLLVSQDEWTSTDTLWSKSENQEDNWNFMQIDIPDSIIGAFQLRFTAAGATSSFGDIAIGDIAFWGIRPVTLQEQIYFPDRDRDGYGNGDTVIFYCGVLIPDSLSAVEGDCNDRDAVIYPNARDTVCNGVDEDCNGIDNLGGAAPLVIRVDSLRHPSCPGTNDGYLAISISGGIPPYTIHWSSGESLLRLDSLLADEYIVEVTDSTGCQRIVKTIQLETANPVQFSFNIIQRPSCPSPSFGTVEVFVSGGVPPYNIYWSNGEIGAQADSLEAGIFQVTVIDAMNCTYNSSEQAISSLQAFPLNVIEVNPVACPGDSTGTLRVIAPGSEPPLNIQWSTGDTTPKITGLTSGYYSVTLTDANDCRLQYDSFFLAPPVPLEIGELVIDPQRCAGERSASMRVQMRGGQPPYTYRWLTPDSTIITGGLLTNINAGIYHLTVTDGYGCKLTRDSVYVDEQLPITLDSLEIQETSCPLSRDGKISFEVQGGNAPYRVNWSDGRSQSTQRTSLNPGVYGLTITDELDCKYTFPDLRVPAGNGRLELELKVIDSLYCGSMDSVSIQATVLNGSSPFQYNWSAGEQHTTDLEMDTLTQNQSGLYSVTVTDGIGCIGRSERLSIDSLAPIQVEETFQVDNICPGDENGEIFVLASSPLGEISYLWSDGSTQSQLDSLSAGNYQVTISDGSECQERILEFDIQSPDSLVVFVDTFQMEGMTCFELDSIKGGTKPYSYYWQNGELSSDSSVFCLNGTENNLTLEIVDDRWCPYSRLIYEYSSQSNGQVLSDVAIYPNPFSNVIFIENAYPEAIQVRLTNLKGQIVYEHSVAKGTHQLHFPHLSSGMYIMTLRLSSGQLLHVKLIRQ